RRFSHHQQQYDTHMTKPELGVKRDCPECGARFYDLNKEPAHCPKCGHEFIPEALLRPRKTRAEEESNAGKETEAEKPATETSLADADDEKTAAKSNRRPSLDDDESDSDEEESGEDLPDIEDIEVDIDDDDDDENDDSLLDDDDDDDVANLVQPGGDDD
ncbi:MAG: TIGR02300 family protein, partial [Pseudomonadota bacterium]